MPSAAEVPIDRVRPHRDAEPRPRRLQGRRRRRRDRRAARRRQRGRRRALAVRRAPLDPALADSAPQQRNIVASCSRRRRSSTERTVSRSLLTTTRTTVTAINLDDPVPALPAAARRGAALLQRAVRLLRGEPLRRLRAGSRRRQAVHLGQGWHPRAHQGRHRDAARNPDLRGPARAHRAPEPARRACSRRAGSPRSSRRSASSAPTASTRSSVRGEFDLIADFGAQMPMRVDRHALRHPRGGPGGILTERSDASLRTEAGQAMDVGAEPDVRQRGVRGVHRLAHRPPLRRPHDRAAPHRVRGRDRRDADADARRGAALHDGRRGRGQRDHDAASSAGPARCWPSTPTSAASSSRTDALDPERPIEELLRFESPGAADRPLHARGRRGARPDAAGRQRDAVRGRRREPRRTPVARRRSLRHPPRDRPAPRVRLRHPLLPRRRARAARGPHRARRVARPVPGVGRRSRPRRDRADVDGPRLRDAPRVRCRDEPARGTNRADGTTARSAASARPRHAERIVAAGAEILHEHRGVELERAHHPRRRANGRASTNARCTATSRASASCARR